MYTCSHSIYSILICNITATTARYVLHFRVNSKAYRIRRELNL